MVATFVSYKYNSLGHVQHNYKLCELMSNTNSFVVTTYPTTGLSWNTHRLGKANLLK